VLVRIEALESPPQPSHSFRANENHEWNSVSVDSWSSDAYSSDVYDIPNNAPTSYDIPNNAPASYIIPNNAPASYNIPNNAPASYPNNAPASYNIPNNAPASYSIPNNAPAIITHGSVRIDSVNNVYASSGYGFAEPMAPINHVNVSSAKEPQSYSQSGSAYPIPCSSIDDFSSSSVHTAADEQSHSSGCAYSMDVTSSVNGPLDALDFDFPLLEDEYDCYSDMEELVTPTMSLHNFTFNGSHSLDMIDATQKTVPSDHHLCSDAKEDIDEDEKHQNIDERSIDSRLQRGNIELVVAGDDIQLKLDRFDVLFSDELEHSCLNIIDESFNGGGGCEKQEIQRRLQSNGSINTTVSALPEQKTGIIRKLIRTLSTSAPGPSSLGLNRTPSGTLPKLHDASAPPPGEGDRKEEKTSSVGSTNSIFSAISIFSRTYSWKNAPVESSATAAPSSIEAPRSVLANFLSLHSPLGSSISPSHVPKRTRKFLF
jgi:hypothetical protein